MAASQAQADALWKIRDDIEGLFTAIAPSINFDVSLPIVAMDGYVTAVTAAIRAEWGAAAQLVVFGHIGDGNLHINVLRPDDLDEATFIAQCEHVTKLLAATLQRHGGSISAEHGIGLVKLAYLESTRSAAEIALMRGVRQAFDPHGILNPGKLFAAL